MSDDRLRERIERLIAPRTITTVINGEEHQRESRKVHVRVRDLRRILDLNAVPVVSSAPDTRHNTKET